MHANYVRTRTHTGYLNVCMRLVPPIHQPPFVLQLAHSLCNYTIWRGDAFMRGIIVCETYEI